MGEVATLPARAITPADAARFQHYLDFYRDGASMSEAQWQAHLKEPAFVVWLRSKGYCL